MSNDKLTDFAIGKMQSFFDTMNAAMPKITHLVLSVTSYDCLINVLTGLIPLVISLTLFRVAWILVGWVTYGSKTYRDSDWIIGAFISFLGGVGAFVGFSVLSLDIWSWIGIWHPDLYLIHMAMQKVGG